MLGIQNAGFAVVNWHRRRNKLSNTTQEHRSSTVLIYNNTTTTVACKPTKVFLRPLFLRSLRFTSVTALHHGAPGQMTWLEDPPPWLRPRLPLCLLLCIASVIVWTENKNFTISDRWPLYLFYFDSETISIRQTETKNNTVDIQLTYTNRHIQFNRLLYRKKTISQWRWVTSRAAQILVYY